MMNISHRNNIRPLTRYELMTCNDLIDRFTYSISKCLLTEKRTRQDNMSMQVEKPLVKEVLRNEIGYRIDNAIYSYMEKMLLNKGITVTELPKRKRR